jgi:5''-nucleotidase/2'',3''-cyclic phosphodiesterase and related esterases
MNKRIFFAILVLFTLSCNSQNKTSLKKISWSVEKIDKSYDAQGTEVEKIIAKYKPEVDKLMEPIGKTKYEFKKEMPESPMSNFAADIIMTFSNKYLKENNIGGGNVDFAVTNFGGIRANLPKGEVTSYDILSIFPFDNKIVIGELKGKDIREMMENFAKREKVEALSGIELVIEKRKVAKFLIGGKKLKDNKTYRVATVDFLLQGGDNIYALKRATNVINTNVLMKDAAIDYIKDITKKEEYIESKYDKRVIIK